MTAADLLVDYGNHSFGSLHSNTLGQSKHSKQNETRAIAIHLVTSNSYFSIYFGAVSRRHERQAILPRFS